MVKPFFEDLTEEHAFPGDSGKQLSMCIDAINTDILQQKT